MGGRQHYWIAGHDVLMILADSGRNTLVPLIELMRGYAEA